MRILRRSLFLSLAVLGLLAAGNAQQIPAQNPAHQPTQQEHVTELASPDRAGQKPTAKNSNGNILPDTFGGWTLKNPPQISKDPAIADSTNPDLLKEYGFTDFEGATYVRDDGHTLKIKAARFQDATGAYGAFTFYKSPEMLNEKIGDQGYSLNNRVLFYRGNILIDAVFQQLSAMSAAELRELAGDLPLPGGAARNLPALPTYLPRKSYEKNTARYILGPNAFEKIQAGLPIEYVNFSKGAEVVLGDYDFSGTPARLMLIGYPTPQIAREELKNLESAEQAHRLGTTPVAIRRSGPIVALLLGAVSQGDAKSFLNQINYDADITWNQNTYVSPRDNVGNLIVGVIMLAAVLCGIAVVAGVAFGGFRILIKRMFPDKVFDRPEQMEIIALHLSDPVKKPGDSA